MTGTAWILGAGFSKAISEHMPTMKELGVAMCSTIAADADLVPLLSAAERAAIRSDIPLGDLEVWLTSLASPQPFLNESENLRRAALSSRLTEIIRSEERRVGKECA